MSDRRKYLTLMGAIMAAVIGAVLLAVPGSPIHRKPILGLDLQGGLEVVLKAVPLKGQQVTPAGMTVAQSIIQSRVDKLGLSSPDVRKQGADQLVVQLAGVHNAAQAAALLGKTAQLMMFDFEADLIGPSTNASGQPVATPSLYDLLSQVQKQAAKGSPEAYYLFRTKTVPAKTKKGSPTVTHSLLQGPQPTLKELLAPYRGTAPANTQVLKVPAHQLVVSCPVANGCLGATVNAPTYYYLFKYDPTAPNGPPELTGRDLTQSGTRADFDPTSGQPIVLLGFTKPRSARVPADHEGGVPARQDRGDDRRPARLAPAAVRAAQRDRARRRPPVDAVHRLHAGLAPERHQRRRRDPDGIGRPERGEGSRARPPDRCAAVQLPAGRAHRRLVDARQGLADAGMACGARRPDRRRASSCSSCTASSASSPCSASPSTRRSTTRPSSFSTSR